MALLLKESFDFPLTEEEAIRRLVDKSWSVQGALQQFKDKQQLYDDYDVTSITEESVISYKKHRFSLIYGTDNEGRPLHWFHVGRVKPNKLDTKKFGRFLIWSTEYFLTQSDFKYLATESNVIDCEGFGYENLNLAFYKRFIELAPTLFPQRAYKTYLVNTNWMLSKSYNLIKYVLPKDVSDRLFIYSDDSYKKDMAKHITKENIPSNYGGTGPKF